jgi:hypothetical protein
LQVFDALERRPNAQHGDAGLQKLGEQRNGTKELSTQATNEEGHEQGLLGSKRKLCNPRISNPLFLRMHVAIMNKPTEHGHVLASFAVGCDPKH